MITQITSTFKTVEFPKKTLAFVRNIGPYKGDTKLFERLFNRVIGWMQPKGLLQPNAECITIYHDDPEKVSEEKHRISVGFTVPEGTVGEKDIRIMEIPAGRYAVGSFEILPDEYGMAWEELYKYLGENNLIPGRMMYESYMNDPREHPEGKHMVDICVAIK